MRRPRCGKVCARSAAGSGRAGLRRTSAHDHRDAPHMADLIYLVITIAVFAVLGLIAKGAEKL
ncbi:hypothetical protein [Streptomyces sp. NBC_01190]|uniref:hypothetical protein n=1 Tax=Streptomyces sp. NBC_01190 TaxID=2903767 RepID=UPI0038650D40|nr:hypothetical protein OG519_31800 [Streptomyces sp. NBC_01190]